MWVRNGGLLAALTAFLSAGAVVAGTWFILTHNALWTSFMNSLGRTGAGLATVAVSVLAGILLAAAFDRVEEAAAIARRSTSNSRDAGGCA